MRWLLPALVMNVATAAAQDGAPPKAAGAIRFATFNAALNDDAPGGVVARLEAGEARARLVAEVIQRVRPDVLLLQELDRDPQERSLALFAALLAEGQGGAAPIRYEHTVFPPSNTGVPSGVDIDGDGRVGGPNDALGYGHHPGQYAFALLSRLPLGATRTFARFLWRDMPDAALPPGHYSAEALAVLPLSSKTHLMVEVMTSGGTVVVLAAHPTPPVFDDPAVDWNGRRNADEIRLLVDLLSVETSGYAVDDEGRAGGLAPGTPAVVMGDLNADPVRGEARPGAIARLLGHPDAVAVLPLGSAGPDTAAFNGGMRVDYVQPMAPLRVTGAGVFRPGAGDPLARLAAASDHHLVWVDVVLP
ncbi:endonuclease/exonuclease/phosphatase family protein [Acuticoccus sp. I52.16.1]|uniref:endonuclease/exonuclease/phosphatase family protein n=1 Tax=Acuticoccus sp. I52.16.1 TaxID=2928472 RepID=UPI001FD32500|nr:endonuclease/exonuclease/phosphatase family protein [Acuticoccus sp. I52.16.1]UOM33581.1 endonuclease/exonuclease/phosphatase family protein [Acuticoccus sp. I52.16.1]